MKRKVSNARRVKKTALLKGAERLVAVPASLSFPVIGIGASAGGLEALEQFLSCVPKGSGMAFVIVQHLDPTHKGIMDELLQRGTGMRVVQVKDATKVRPDCVYLIPPQQGYVHPARGAAPAQAGGGARAASAH